MDTKLKKTRLNVIKEMLKEKNIILNDKEEILSLVEKNPEVTMLMSDELYNDMVFWYKILQVNGLALEYLPSKFAHIDVFSCLAANQNGLAIEYANDNVKNILGSDGIEEVKKHS